MRYIIGFLVTIGLLVLILVLLLRGGGSGPVTKPLNLVDYSYTGATAELIIDGPIVSDQSHQELKIDVAQNNVAITTYQGYQQSITNSKSYVNNETSFAVFLQALQHAGFTKGNSSAKMRDERGYCPGGDRYIYSFSNNGKNLMRFWSTSCGSPSTYSGLVNTTLFLFKSQIPDYADQTKTLTINNF